METCAQTRVSAAADALFTRKYHNTVRRKAKMNITKRLLVLILIFSFALPLAH